MADPRLPYYHAFEYVTLNLVRRVLTSNSAAENLIEVQVGNSKKPFRIHESKLCSSSEFFNAKKKPEWSYGKGQVELPAVSSAAFALYVNWLYSGKIPTAVHLQDCEENEKEWTTLASAYALGEEILDTAFKDTVIDALRAKVNSTLGPTMWLSGGEIIKIIYGGTPEGSAARTFLVDIYSFNASKKDLACAFDDAPKDFYFDVAATRHRMNQRLLAPSISAKPGVCVYHSHRKDEGCYLDQS